MDARETVSRVMGFRCPRCQSLRWVLRCCLDCWYHVGDWRTGQLRHISDRVEYEGDDTEGKPNA